ncbi:hypothetical protein RRG08_020700 [Elysia crispata]|uniref:Uncharacterized protein n=1 Tax=Elysia crispata TaxID=231223 RepID=A0AAE0ZN87_9GAST|nr:hypothetical protein RRG08_020700 [Elysia crispata]
MSSKSVKKERSYLAYLVKTTMTSASHAFPSGKLKPSCVLQNREISLSSPRHKLSASPRPRQQASLKLWRMRQISYLTTTIAGIGLGQTSLRASCGVCQTLTRLPRGRHSHLRL